MPEIEHAFGLNHGRFYLERLERRGVVLAAWRQDKPVGVVWASLEPADEWIVRLLLRGVPLLYRLRVRDGMRGQGIGTMLLAEAEERLRRAGRKRVAVGVDHKSRRVMDFYRRRGYRRWGFGLLIPTFEESYTGDGRRVLRRDWCRVLVKRL